MIALKQILVQLLHFNALDRKSILLLLDDVEDRNIYFALKKGIRDGLITEHRVTYTRDNRDYAATYFTLSANGLSYILEDEEISTTFPWLAIANIPTGKLSILGRNDGSASGKYMLKYLQVTYAAIMAKKIGAKVNPMYYDMMDYFGLERFYKAHGNFNTTDDQYSDVEVVDDDDAPKKQITGEALPSSVNKVNHLSSIVMKAKIAYEEYVRKVEEEEKGQNKNSAEHKVGDQDSDDSKEMIFLNSSEVRNIQLNNVYNRQNNPENLRADVVQSRTSQMNGILDTGNQVFVLFTEPPYGMSWTITDRSPDMMLYRTYLNEMRPDDPSSKNREHRGFLFVRTPDEFYRNFYDTYYRRTTEPPKEEDPKKTEEQNKEEAQSKNTKKKRKTKPKRKRRKDSVQRDPFTIGDEFNNLYMIPIDDIGVEHMQFVIDSDDDDIEKHMIQWGEENGLELAERIDNARVFTLHDPKDDSYLFYGGMMDIVKMNSLAKTIAKHPELKVKIFCFEWQEVYYNKLFPNAEIAFPS